MLGVRGYEVRGSKYEVRGSRFGVRSAGDVIPDQVGDPLKESKVRRLEIKEKME